MYPSYWGKEPGHHLGELIVNFKCFFFISCICQRRSNANTSTLLVCFFLKRISMWKFNSVLPSETIHAIWYPTHKSWSSLFQVVACTVVAWWCPVLFRRATAKKTYNSSALTHRFWLIIDDILWHSSEGNFTENAHSTTDHELLHHGTNPLSKAMLKVIVKFRPLATNLIEILIKTQNKFFHDIAFENCMICILSKMPPFCGNAFLLKMQCGIIYHNVYVFMCVIVLYCCALIQ